MHFDSPLNLIRKSLIIVSLGSFFLISCSGLLEPPSGGKVAANSFDHVAGVSTCASCHDSGKGFPAVPSGHPSMDGQDCSACHQGFTQWKSGTFSHTASVVSCGFCHGGGAPNDRVPKTVLNEMQHALTWVPDCISCHAAGSGTSWSGAKFNHTPFPSSCHECHQASQPSGPIGPKAYVHASADCAPCHSSGAGSSWVIPGQ